MKLPGTELLKTLISQDLLLIKVLIKIKVKALLFLSILILNKPKKLEEILRADYLIKKLLTVFILIIKKSFNQTLILLLHLYFLIQVEIEIF
jgi:hypothetical protein